MCVAIVLGVVWVYAPVVTFDFVNLDDPHYVTENARVGAGLSRDGLAWAFTAYHSGHWHPLTWLSHMLDCQIFGIQEASGHHLVNVGLHATNAVLLWVALWRLTGQPWPSFLVAALFAIHPLRVESVAWVTGRKDVLSGLFFMLTLLTYSWYVRQRRLLPYLCVTGAFALGLLAKPILVTVPFVLLLLDYWPLGRIRIDDTTARQFGQLVLEKVPLLLLVGASCVVTILAQGASGAISGTQLIAPAWRVANAFVAYFLYIFKTVWPTGLAVFYPHPASIPDQNYGLWMAGGAAAAVLFLIVTTGVLLAARRFPFLAVGWLWYAGMLVPVIGLLQVGLQAWADRFSYLPLIGIYLMVAWSLDYVTVRLPQFKIAFVTLAVVFVALMAVMARGQVRVWENSERLFTHALQVTESNYVAHTNLGGHLQKLDRTAEAASHFEAAVRLQPDDAKNRNNWGNVLQAQGKMREAITNYEIAVDRNPQYAQAYINWGNALQELKRYDEACERYQEAAKHRPDDATVHFFWGIALQQLERFDKAIEHYQKALKLQPTPRDLHKNLGMCLLKVGRTEEARPHLAHAWSAPEVDFRIARTSFHRKKFEQAIASCEKVLQVNAGHVRARRMLAESLVALGRPDEAVQHYEIILRQHPEHAPTHVDLANLFQILNRHQRAIAHWRSARQLVPDNAAIVNNLAWLLATCPNEDLRDAKEAVRLATRAVELSNGENAIFLGTLAVSYAAAGDFETAAVWQSKALALAGDERKAEFAERLREYEAKSAGGATGPVDDEQNGNPADTGSR